ncbi:hypothetical protein GALL_462380 [mine drainage metagenome]|uniref:Uncharacterized protein n=1 Tax=mine drainage metagenome TaxID=410659 RepID=A0A1J5PLT9_9ZZZZ
MRAFLLSLPLALSMLSTGQCAGIHALQTYAGADGGILLASFSTVGSSAVALVLAPADNSDPGKVWQIYGAPRFMSKGDFSEHLDEAAARKLPAPPPQFFTPMDIPGVVRTFRIAPGRYHISQFNVSSSGCLPTYCMTIDSPGDANIDFEIIPGRVTYLGRFVGLPGYVMTPDGHYQMVGWRPYRFDRRQEDEETALRKGEISPEQVAPGDLNR